MDESLAQSMSIKRVSKKIKKKKELYIKLTIALLIINFISMIFQGYKEISSNEDNNTILIKNLFLILEDFVIKVIIIISLIKMKINPIILGSFLYFIIGIIMLYYIIFNRLFNLISEEQKINGFKMAFFICNIILFCLEGFLLIICTKWMRKEKKETIKEKYGFKTGEDMIKSRNILDESIFS